MKISILIMQLVLLIWFFGCIITYKIGKYKLVEGMGIKSAEFVMFILYLIGIIITRIFIDVGMIYTLIILLCWIVIQFFCHWYYTIFGASKRKIQGYNKCFADTIHLFPIKENRLVPDLYHIILHILIIINISLILIFLF